MDTGETYEVKDLNLAEQGKMNMELAESNMGALLEIRRKFEQEKPLQGIRIGMALHVTKETAILVRTLIAGGADVAITGCNPLSTQDDVAAALAKEGVKVWGYKGETNEDYYKYITNIINFKPHITIDDGCDLVSEIHKNHAELIPSLIGGCEETTTGIIRLKSMVRDNALKYPVVAVNDNKTKHLLDNVYGTAQSTMDGIIRATNILFAGKTVVVLGYGSCGKGFANSARGLGANVVVTEVANFPALQARMDGFRVMKMEDACKEGEIFLTVTGNKHVIRTEHMKEMKSGAIIANSGHFDIEIDIKGLKEIASSERRIRPFMDEYILNGKKIFVCGEGRLINLAAAEGHPSEVMSTSFCGQALACEYLVKNKGQLKPEVIFLPEEMDDNIAGLQLEAMGIAIDELTEEQKKYLSSWEEGT
ncbi:adenosylhomocysteinase [Candidatus Woesearchaeota archaeon]|jgi:adenosylhomocysteinase|nr:adenosylhomocysteinase [Candidatus Woesearchaeota archaeon]MBT5272804.1 adenosylhomocysteinase [Candidatus Woesearchaeota archaeon]MBT6040416.1 adenosylhomocysteinase [Candidatus Woesearchaeota archaeon]MBT6336951.1 adenosylhomocysteinase [Candidatus Woesearchaeota archaeon]MBT7926837.1 adenosylhomocysteinase [Candidatus Woesearchaeota archaeon]